MKALGTKLSLLSATGVAGTTALGSAVAQGVQKVCCNRGFSHGFGWNSNGISMERLLL